MTDTNNSARSAEAEKYQAHCAACDVSWHHRFFKYCPLGEPIPKYAQSTDTPYRHQPHDNANDKICGRCAWPLWRKYCDRARRSLTERQIRQQIAYSRAHPSRILTADEEQLTSANIRRKSKTVMVCFINVQYKLDLV
jgi:hypothetical protein